MKPIKLKSKRKVPKLNYYGTNTLGTEFKLKEVECRHFDNPHRVEVIARNPSYSYMWQWTLQEMKDLNMLLTRYIKKKENVKPMEKDTERKARETETTDSRS